MNACLRSLMTIATMLLVAYADVRIDGAPARSDPAVAATGVRADNCRDDVWPLILAGNPGVSEWGTGLFPGLSADQHGTSRTFAHTAPNGV